MDNNMRKEIHLDKEVVRRLKELAKTDRRMLKPYMEKVLIEHSDLAIEAVRQKKKK